MTSRDETLFSGEDMARVINAMKPELHDRFAEIYPNAARYMHRITTEPERHVQLRVADEIVTAMGCPHVLTNGAVAVVYVSEKVASGHPRSLNGYVVYPQEMHEGVLLDAGPFRKWMERQSRHYKSLKAMYTDLDLTQKQGEEIWRGKAKKVHSHVVEMALSRRGCAMGSIYPQFRLTG